MRGGWRRLATCATLLAVAAGCGLFRPAPPPIVGGVQVGVASWYGPGFDGNRTANGEIYDQYELTAAHPSLPLGTRAMVTNLDNGRAVEVRINDRGPFVGGRAIDLSYGAARALRMVGPGTARVRIEVLAGTRAPRVEAASVPAPPLPTLAVTAAPAAAPPVAAAPVSPAPPPAPAGSWTIEVASLSDAGRALHLRTVLARRFPDAFVSPLRGAAGSYYRVRIGPYPLRTVARSRAELVTRLGYPAIIVTDEP
jgi:rare lipoprotein A